MKMTAIILAGGKSSRMGEDKGLMLFNGKPMIQYIIDTVCVITDQIIIVSNNKEYEKFKLPVYEDLIKNQGPLAGIYTGLNYTKTDKNIVLSCDVPFVSAEVVKELMANCKNAEVVIGEHNGRTHQLIGIYDQSIKAQLKEELSNKQRKIKLVLEKLSCKTINLDHFNARIFSNINSRNDIEA